MKFIIYSLSFLVGLAVLVIEIVAGRVMAPNFGNTVLTWATVISTVLFGLSTGYAWGGRLAKQQGGNLSRLVKITTIFFLGSSLVVGIIPLIGNWWIQHTAARLPYQLAHLMAALPLFAPISLLLAALTPMLVELLSRMDEQPSHSSGSSAGRVFAVSTIGSLIGAWATGFILIPHLPLSTILKSIALLLLIAGFILYFFLNRFAAMQIATSVSEKKLSSLLLLLALLSTLTISVPLNQQKLTTNLLWKSQNMYQQHLVWEENGSRYLLLDRTTHGGEKVDSPNFIVLPYVKIIDLLDKVAGNYQRALILGGGTYTIPKSVAISHPASTITVVEIDPQVTAIAQKFFNLARFPDIKVFHHDSRVFLQSTAETWDWIWLDAFRDFTAIPTHLLSREFFEKLAQHLEPDGIAIVNTIMKIPLSNEDPVLGSILKTLSAVFPQLIAVQIQNAPSDSMANVVFLAAKGPHFNDKIAATFTNLPSLNGDRRFSLKRFDNSSVLRGAGQLLTDDWNPIEHYLLAYNHTH